MTRLPAVMFKRLGEDRPYPDLYLQTRVRHDEEAS